MNPSDRSNITDGIRSACALGLLVMMGGCDIFSADKVSEPSHTPEPINGIIHLTAEKVASAGLEIRMVSRGEFQSHRDFPGTVVPNQHALAEVTALVRGRVLDVYADLGQQVQTGTVLAMLYSEELGMAQSAYLKADARLYVAEQAYERAKYLVDQKVLAIAEAQRRKGEMLTLRAEKREQRDRLRLYGMSDEQIRRLNRDDEIRSQVPIVAPFDSRVIGRNLTKGEVVETTEKLFTVADLSEVWVLAKIPEKDIQFIHSDDQSVEVLIKTYPDQIFHGAITYVGDVLDVATRTMNLRLELSNQDKKLKPEMFATVRIYSDPELNVLAIPEAAVQRDQDRQFVFVQADAQSFEARDVTLGESNGQQVKILAGLQEGEPIVVKGAFVLKSHLLGEQL